MILPASAFAEKSGTFTNTDRRVQLAREVIKPPGDARQDLWIIQEIAKRMGLPWNYSGPADVFTEMTEVMPSLQNITWERLVREGAVTYPVDDPHKPGNEIIFTTGFPTESGRGKIVPARVIPPDKLPDVEYRFSHWLSRKECSYASFKACAMSAVRSDGCSMPIDSRIVELRTPIFWRMSAGTPEWVMLAGRLASDSVPPRLTASLKICSAFKNLNAADCPPTISNENVEPAPVHCLGNRRPAREASSW